MKNTDNTLKLIKDRIDADGILNVSVNEMDIRAYINIQRTLYVVYQLITEHLETHCE